MGEGEAVMVVLMVHLWEKAPRGMRVEMKRSLTDLRMTPMTRTGRAANDREEKPRTAHARVQVILPVKT